MSQARGSGMSTGLDRDELRACFAAEDQAAAQAELQQRAAIRARMLVLEALHRASAKLAPDECDREHVLATGALQIFRTFADISIFTDDIDAWIALARAWLIRPGAPRKAKTRRATVPRMSKSDMLAKLIGDHMRDRTHVAGPTLRKQWSVWCRGPYHLRNLIRSNHGFGRVGTGDCAHG